jgi:hypothetical protein
VSLETLSRVMTDRPVFRVVHLNGLVQCSRFNHGASSVTVAY